MDRWLNLRIDILPLSTGTKYENIFKVYILSLFSVSHCGVFVRIDALVLGLGFTHRASGSPNMCSRVRFGHCHCSLCNSLCMKVCGMQTFYTYINMACVKVLNACLYVSRQKYVCNCMQTCVLMHVEVEGWCLVSSMIFFQLRSRVRVSHWTQGFLFQLVLAIKLAWEIHCLPSAFFHDCCDYRQTARSNWHLHGFGGLRTLVIPLYCLRYLPESSLPFHGTCLRDQTAIMILE